MKQRIVDLLMKLVGATFIVSLSDGKRRSQLLFAQRAIAWQKQA